jgi:hypothetical protein
MILRPYNYRLDAMNVHRAWKNGHSDDFSLPALNNVVTDLIAYNDNNQLIAFGFVKAFAEGVVVMNMDLPLRERMLALQPLMTEAFSGCRRKGIEQLHVSVTDEKFGRLLMKHYNFNETEGQILIAEV